MRFRRLRYPLIIPRRPPIAPDFERRSTNKRRHPSPHRRVDLRLCQSNDSATSPTAGRHPFKQRQANTSRRAHFACESIGRYHTVPEDPPRPLRCSPTRVPIRCEQQRPAQRYGRSRLRGLPDARPLLRKGWGTRAGPIDRWRPPSLSRSSRDGGRPIDGAHAARKSSPTPEHPQRVEKGSGENQAQEYCDRCQSIRSR